MCRKSYERGLVSAASGNVSLQIAENKVLITPSGISLGSVTAEQIITIDLEGNVIEGDLTPSKETDFHVGILKNKDKINSVFHLHPPFAIAYVNTKDVFRLPTGASRELCRDYQIVAFAPAGSRELAEKVLNVIQDDPSCSIIFLKEHGLITMGEDLQSAYNISDLIEDTAKINVVQDLL